MDARFAMDRYAATHSQKPPMRVVSHAGSFRRLVSAVLVRAQRDVPQTLNP